MACKFHIFVSTVLIYRYNAGKEQEEYVRWLCSRGIDYHFGEIDPYSRRLAEVFQAVYEGSQVWLPQSIVLLCTAPRCRLAALFRHKASRDLKHCQLHSCKSIRSLEALP